MINDTGSKFDDYSISPKIRQMLLHWGYELTEKYFLLTLFQTVNYITSEFNFVTKNISKAQTQAIIYINSEFNFYKTKKIFIGLILDNNLYN